MHVDYFPLSVHLNHYAAFVVCSHFDPFWERGADEQCVAGNGGIAVALNVQVGEVKATLRFLSLIFRAEDGSA